MKARLTSAYISDHLTQGLRVQSHYRPAFQPVTERANQAGPVSDHALPLSASRVASPINVRTRSVTPRPVFGRGPSSLFLFLSPQPLCSCFQLAIHKVQNLCVRALAFFKEFYKG